MRISTKVLYDRGVAAMQNQQYKLMKLQEQVSSGRRVLTPSDDPVASARALEVSQSLSSTEQFLTNQKTVNSTLAIEENTLGGVQNALQHVRDLAVSGGNATYDDSQRGYLAGEIRSMLDEIIGQANATDGNGQYLFSGFQGSTKPFVQAGGTVTYQGDDGQRLAQVSPSRRLAISDSGADAFMRIKDGNGHFSTSPSPSPIATTNTGTGVISPGNVINPTLWDDPNNGKNYSVIFAVDNTGPKPVTTYDIVANTSTVINGTTYNAGDSILTGAPSAAVASGTGGPTLPRTYTSGQAIDFKYQAGDTNPDTAWDLGINVEISGDPLGSPAIGAIGFPLPATVDQFTIAASKNESVFDTLDKLATMLETPLANGNPQTASANRARLGNAINQALTNIDNSLQNLSTVRAAVGSRLQEASDLQNINEDLSLQYKQSLSNLQDLDYADAVSQLSQQQVALEASQKTYQKVTGLSLFNYL